MKTKSIFLLALVSAFAWIGCNEETSDDGYGSASVAALTSSDVDRVEITVDGTSFAETLSRDPGTGNFEPVVISDIPIGSYTFRAQAYDDTTTPGTPILLYEGTAPATITEGVQTAVTILLQQVPPADPFVNTVPIFQSLVYTPANPRTDEVVTLTVSVLDPDVGDVVTLLWSAPGGGTLTPPLDQPSVDWTAPSTDGTYPVTITASDLSGATSTLTANIGVSLRLGSAEVSIDLNTWPEVSNLVPDPTRIDVNETTSLTLTATDPDGDDLAYAWSATGCAGTFSDPSAGGAPVPPSAPTTVANPDFTLTADNGGAPCTLTATITDVDAVTGVPRGGSNTADVTIATGPAVSQTAGPGTCGATLISVNRDGTSSGNGPSFDPALSANGRFVAFVSDADDLTLDDGHPEEDVFIRDTVSGVTTLVSLNLLGTSNRTPNSNRSEPAISSEGRFVAWTSADPNLVANDLNGQRDVFLRDTVAGVTTLVSENFAGTGSGNGLSENVDISADGTVLVFSSTASDLVGGGDTNGPLGDIFLRDTTTGSTSLVSANLSGTGSGNATSLTPKISADGNFVCWSSNASDLVAPSIDTNGSVRDVFLRDISAGTTMLVSVNRFGTGAGNANSFDCAVSADGRFVAFASDANDLVTGDGNGLRDVFVRDMLAGVTTLASVDFNGTDSGNGSSSRLAISDDGRFVVLQSFATDLIDPSIADGNGQTDVFVRDTIAGITKLVSINVDGTGSGNVGSVTPAISGGGDFVGWYSSATDLADVLPDTNGTFDVFVNSCGLFD